MPRALRAALAALVFVIVQLVSPPKGAAATLVAGRVVDAQSQPVASAAVSLAGQNRVFQTTTASDGSFSFAAVDPGEYELRVSGATGSARSHVFVTAANVAVLLRLADARSLGTVVVSSGAVQRNAGSTLITARQLSHSPSSSSVSDILAQLPAVARASNGQIHVNGDHGDLNYYLDGVPLPQSLNRVLGSELDPSTLAFVDVIEGAYPAQYGNKFAAVVNVATVSGAGDAGGEARASASSFGGAEASLGAHAHLGTRGGGYSLALRTATLGWALDPPVRSSNHDSGSAASQFVRFTLPSAVSDAFNIDLSHSYQTFAIPPDTRNGVPASTDDAETQEDSFVSLRWQHALGEGALFSMAPFFRRSHIRDFADVANDLLPAAGNDCHITPSDCLFAAADDRTASSGGLAASYERRSSLHQLKAGATYEADAVAKRYDITLQAHNFIQAGPLEIVDDRPNTGHLASAYVQDGWRVSPRWRLDFGVREDAFELASADFVVAYAQASPRVRVTRTLGTRSDVYAYYGRLFTPFSFENISAGDAGFLDPSSGKSFDLKPQRDSLYELGGQFPLGRAQGSWRLAHKTSVDVIDDGQVGATNIHQDINFAQGRTDVASVLVQWPRADGGRSYVSLTRSRAVVKGCGSSLLVDCSQFPDDFVNADHDQRWSATGGVDVALRDGWVALDGEYGSGLSTRACDACKAPPHLTFDAELGKQVSPRGTLVLAVRNVLNDLYAITLNSSLQGTHYAKPRTVEVSYRLRY